VYTRHTWDITLFVRQPPKIVDVDTLCIYSGDKVKCTWDETKNKVNRQKHGIDFVDVATMFDLPMVLFLDQKKQYGEDRWVGIGWLADMLAVVVFTELDAGNTVRIISARKANRHEQDIYAEEIRD